VELAIDPSSVRVTIEDTGIGFDVADVERPGKRRGLGLLSIRERVTGLRGRVRIESASGGSRIEGRVARCSGRVESMISTRISSRR
jgi:signal transduction histidine kinase